MPQLLGAKYIELGQTRSTDTASTKALFCWEDSPQKEGKVIQHHGEQNSNKGPERWNNHHLFIGLFLVIPQPVQIPSTALPCGS